MATKTPEATPRFAKQRSFPLAHLLERAGVTLNGPNRWDPQIRDQRMFRAVKRRALLGLGESYVAGWWECDAIDELFDRLLRAGVQRAFRNHPVVLWRTLIERTFNLQNVRKAWRNGRAHYNLGNDLFEAMLDKRMAYSCGDWRSANNLDEAQEAKLDLICRKLDLSPGIHLLDIGCGWGSLVKFAAQRYDVHAVGVTVSEEQVAFVKRSCKGLNVDVKLMDYRSLHGKFDRVASVGMFEHVGPKNYATFMRVARSCLAGDGLFVLHTFASRDSFPSRDQSEVHWVNDYIFPGLVVPSMAQMGKALDGTFVVEDVENFGACYDQTLLAWCERFERAWPSLREKYDERFHRMWRYYLRISAGAFRARRYQVWQFTFSPEGVPDGYQRPDRRPPIVTRTVKTSASTPAHA